MDPALRSFDPAHLDTGQSLIQLLGDRSHLGHAAGQADLFAVVNDLTNRGDNCCGTAQTSLCEVFYFIQVYFSLFYFQSQIFLVIISKDFPAPTQCASRVFPPRRILATAFFW